MNYYVSDSVLPSMTNSIFLVPDNWDDYCFRTSFFATYINKQGEKQYLGSIKIGVHGANVTEGTYWTKDNIPYQFDNLSEDIFSLWQSADTYQMIRDIMMESGCNIFEDLNDISYNLNLLNIFWSEPIMQSSLIRSIPRSIIEQQFHRITLGQAKLTKYSFAFEIGNGESIQRLTFDVNPDSCPPTNVHVLIAGNGVGKTTIIKEMIKHILQDEDEEVESRFVYDYSENEASSDRFVNVVCVSFSPFDDFSLFENYDDKKFSYIGTRKKYNIISKNEQGVMNLLDDIEEEFIESMKLCLSNPTKRADLGDVINILENDVMFSDYKIEKLIVPDDEKLDYDDMTSYKNIFSNMSSGHKVVMSIIVRCIDKISEKTILFLDEPENHLHPPLVSSLIRAISTILMKRNGVAIISTHSPIVLQETPKSCVWILSRSGEEWGAYRPRFETFGENIGSLTNDVFKYEINKSGFHELIRKSVLECNTYEEVLNLYNNQLGDEARGLIRILFAQKACGEL